MTEDTTNATPGALLVATVLVAVAAVGRWLA